MTEPVWITEEDCLSFHDKLLARFGGASGVRDRGLPLSALAGPQNLFAHEKPSLFNLAATYAHGIVTNHPFFDGNKRTDFLAAIIFLEANRIRFHAAEPEVIVQTLGLAAGAVDVVTFAAWMERSSTVTQNP